MRDFTAGLIVAMAPIPLAMGFAMASGLRPKQGIVVANIDGVNWYAVALGLLTFTVTKYLLKVSPFIPAPLIALALATGLFSTLFAGKGLTPIKDKYGASLAPSIRLKRI